MDRWVDVARVAAAVNVLVLLGLGTVWLRNFVKFRSKHTLGLATFATFLLAENAFALYYYQVDPTLSVWFSTAVPAVAWQAMLTLHVLETLALAVLAWVTWD
ncbi:hypothetical protein SAMN04487949_0737 [Halogranum gelatinilyticum]|uniref:Uncharacterized protein n=1 Tax=Halogranum gelatinilyticum TaxID=660521 RepID=A0A1G9Q8G8_9EURY|nr:hypothetical protein [Halogranum gelatinilyticum]SDM07354.1 hypothetical protein SAMN04487949_0737 [Halogranum gelatinilyticum]